MARQSLTSREVRIEAAPPGTTLQDAGRAGWLHAGVPPSGPLDPTAHAAANLAVGNDPGAAAIEVPLGAMRVTVNTALGISIDGEPALTLAPGDALTVAACRRAVRYLAVGGGFAVPLVLGSRSTLLSAGWGGFFGRALRAGDVLSVGPALERGPRAHAAPSVTDPPEPAVLRVRPGPHVDRFASDTLSALVASTWRVSARADRVGVRLEGPPLRRTGDDRGPPCPMLRGAMQITTDGTPIVLGPDHPVTGGYPVLAVLSRTSQAILARLRATSAIRFALETS
jgi:biotin-dependent carboxylase-like uncharacterized protein